MSKRDKINGQKILGGVVDEVVLFPDDPTAVVKFSSAPNTHCCVCGTEIKVQIYKNTGVCCELHRKDRDNDHGPARIAYTAAR